MWRREVITDRVARTSPGRGLVVTAAIGVAVLSLLAGCVRSSGLPATPATKSIDGGGKTDPAPVLKRLPGLAQPQDIRWASGTFGDPRNPGPSTYWIDALVILAPADVAGWQALATDPAVPPADVAAPVAATLPPGAWRGSPALDAALKPLAGWSAHGYLAEGKDLLLVTAMGE